MTRRTGWSVTPRITPSSAAPSAGVPRASKTTTPSSVTTKPAFELKPSSSFETMPARPRTSYTRSVTRTGPIETPTGSNSCTVRAGGDESAVAGPASATAPAIRIFATRRERAEVLAMPGSAELQHVGDGVDALAGAVLVELAARGPRNADPADDAPGGLHEQSPTEHDDPRKMADRPVGGVGSRGAQQLGGGT